MVGERRSSHAITEEYAKADPVYVAKTAVCWRRGRGRDEGEAEVEALLTISSIRPCPRSTRTIDRYWAMATVDGGVCYYQNPLGDALRGPYRSIKSF